MQGRGDVSDATLAVNTRKRPHEPTTSSGVVRAIQYDTYLANPGRSEELPDAPTIKQRLISIHPAAGGAAGSVADRRNQPFILSLEQQQEATSDARLVTVIDYFPPAMHQRLQTFRNDQTIRGILASASLLLEMLSTREINLSRRRKKPQTPTLFALLDKCNLYTDLQLITKYFRKTAVFFSAVDTRIIKDTGCLTNMMQYKAHMRAFTNMFDDVIRSISASPHLKRLACVYSGKGLPDGRNLVLNASRHNLAPERSVSQPRKTGNTELNETLSAFPPSHREHLRKSPDDRHSSILLSDARKLIDTLRQKNIPLVFNTRQQSSARLFDLIRDMDPVKDWQFISTFFRKAVVFFANVDTSIFKKTSHLSGMLQHRIHVEQFTAMEDADIAAIARHPLLIQISSHCHGKGLPDPAQIRHITQWKEVSDATNVQNMAKAAPQADDALATVINYFLLPHQLDLQQYRHMESIQLLLRSAAKMVETLAKRKIKLSMNRCKPPIPSLFSLLRSFAVVDHYPLMTLYFNKVEVFFSAVDNSVIRTTSCLTNMIRLKAQVRSLVETTDDTLRKLASNPCLGQPRQDAVLNFPTASGDAAPPNDSGVDNRAGQGNFVSHEDILPFVTSMCCDQGVPSADDVRDFLKHLQGQKLSVLYTIASMCKGRGIPDTRLIDDFLTLGADESTLGMLSTVCRAQGIPPADDVSNFLQWLPTEQITSFMNLLCQFFSRTGVPKISALIEEEKALETIFCSKLPTKASRSRKDQLKLFVLFCLNPNKWHLNREEFKDFLDTAHFASRRQALDTMQSIVLNLGGPGVSLWLTKYHDNCQHMDVVAKALLMSAPLDTISNALSQLPAPQWLLYIELCKRLSPLPGRAQWELLLALMQNVEADYPPGTANRKMLLEILWIQDDCWTYVSYIDRLLKTVPTVKQLYKVYCQLTTKKMKNFLDACLVWQGEKNNPPEQHDIESLMDGLLLAHYPIDCPWEIPEMSFSKISENSANKGVTIDGTTVMTGKERLWHFVTAMLMELNRVGYDYCNNRMMLKSHVGKNLHLPKPKFTLTESGFVIDNWSSNMLNAFFLATNFTEYNSHPSVREKIALKYRNKAVTADNPTAAAADRATIQAITTQAITTQAVTSQAATTQAITTQAVTTQAVTSQAATTQAITTQASTTQAVTSQAVTTQAVTSQAVTTQAATTQAVTSQAITTQAVTTQAVTTQAATTQAVTSQAITTQAVTTQAITTQAVTTQAVTTQAVTTQAATSRVAATRAETTRGCQTVTSRAVTSLSSTAQVSHQATVPVTPQPDSVANTPEDGSLNTPDYLIGLPDFSWLEREFDFPEDLAKSVPKVMSVEKMKAILGPVTNAPLSSK